MTNVPAGAPNGQARAGVALTGAAPITRIEIVRRSLGLAAVCLLAFSIGAIGITDKGYVSLHGDMPRHLMNGVFFSTWFAIIRLGAWMGSSTIPATTTRAIRRSRSDIIRR